jgi:2-succinyl-5-enolpyruvyl-6-hydroxy-3-cyclohexene-1-carboxylate synthase
VVLLIGDVALAHDIGGLLAAAPGLKLTIVLLDNGGGGIFDFLAVSRRDGARGPPAAG